MSHTATVSTKLTSIPMLREAVAYLKRRGVNIALEENTKPRMWYPDQLARTRPSAVAPYVVRLPDAYFDIAVVNAREGAGYELDFDGYGRHSPHVPESALGKGPIASVLGCKSHGECNATEDHVSKLLTAYTACVSRKALTNQGLRVQIAERPDGSLVLVGQS